MLVISIILAGLGLCFGSFVNALVWRVYQQEHKGKKSKQYSVLKGRSMCPHCKQELATKDLLPLLSWILLRGRCRYCKKSISKQYPAVELAMAAVFVASYVFWPSDLAQTGHKILFVTWLASSVGLMALLVYDFKWTLLPNRILYPTFFVALIGRLTYILFYSNDIARSFWFLALSLVIASGLFWALYTASKGTWIGFGDVRLGLVTGTLLATPGKALLMIFMASALGTIYVLPGLALGRLKRQMQLPYGPFLIVGTMIAVLWGDQIIVWYRNLVL